MASAGERASREDPKYSRLVKEHGEYDRRLKQLQSQRYLSDEEQLEEVRLKKMKLAVKDQMEAMLQAGSR